MSSLSESSNVIMRWRKPSAAHSEWMRQAHLANEYVMRVDWREMPSNQFASAEDMASALWKMPQERDAKGRLK